MISKSVAATLAALDRAARPRVAGETAPSLFTAPPERSAAVASPSTAAATDDDDLAGKLNAERGLRPGANPGGARFVPGAIPASRDGDALSPSAAAAAINDAHAHIPGFTVPQDRYVRRADR